MEKGKRTGAQAASLSNCQLLCGLNWVLQENSLMSFQTCRIPAAHTSVGSHVPLTLEAQTQQNNLVELHPPTHAPFRIRGVEPLLNEAFLGAKIHHQSRKKSVSQTYIFESSFAFIVPVSEERQKVDAPPTTTIYQQIPPCLCEG